jgi:hypothetical protein
VRGLILVGLLIANSCATTTRYSISVVNSTSEKIEDAHVYYDGFRSIGGSLTPGQRKSHVFVPKPVPAVAIVEWRTTDGHLHRKSVAVKKILPRNFRGDIYFEIVAADEVRVWSKTE